MHRLHQTSILILATILLSTSSLSGCRSPAARRAAMEEVEYAAKAIARRLPKSSLQEERLITTSLESWAIQQARKKQAIISAYSITADNFYSHSSTTSIDDLRVVSLRNIIQETRMQGITLSDSQLNEISDTIANIIFKKYKVTVNAYLVAYDNLQQKANNASLTELKEVAYQGATEEAQRQGINLSDTHLQVIATAAATAAWQKYQQEQQQEQQKSS